MQTRTRIVIGAGIVGVIALAMILAASGSRVRGIEVRMDTVERRDLVAIVTASGNVRARRKVDISSDISARVNQLLVEEGQDVEEGQVLLRLDPSRYQAALDRSEASLSQSQAQVAQTRANLLRAARQAERMSTLRARDSLLVSLQEVENAETDHEVQQSLLDAAEFGVSQARAAVEEARDQVSKTIIRAPMSGRVTRLNVEEGETVVVGTMNNPGSLILTVSDLSVMEVVLEVDETDVPEISLGDSAAVELDAFPETIFPGVVTEIGNSAIRPPSQAAGSGQTPTIDFEVVVTLRDPSAELRPDLSATAEVITETRTNQLAIPIIALTLREPDDFGYGDPGGGTAAASVSDNNPSRTDAEDDEPIEGVFVVTAGIAHFTPVEIGISGQEFFEVVRGLAQGDSIVSGPYETVRTLEDDSAVQSLDASSDDESENESG